MEPPDADHLTAAQAAQHADRARQFVSDGAAHITPTTIRSWVHRGHLTATGLAEDNRSRTYRLQDVARAELATRARALRHVSS
ncbi:MerR family transcriptional regulator [Streptomyces microflavus]